MLQIIIIIYERPHFSAFCAPTGGQKAGNEILVCFGLKRAERDKHHGDNLT